MPKLNLFAFVLLLAAPTVVAKEKAAMPAIVTNATYVMVNGDVLNPEVSPDDRHAVSDVRQALEKWGRYKLVYKLGEADLLLVVRTGRSLEMRGSVQAGTGPGRPGGWGMGAQNGDPQDTLDIL